MPKKPLKTDANELEADAEKAVAKAIDEVAPPELKEPATSFMQSVLRETERQPLIALLIATAIGYVIAALANRFAR